MRAYKEWADFMFPKMPFADILKRIFRLSKTQKSMRIYVRSLRDALREGKEFNETLFMTDMALAHDEVSNNLKVEYDDQLL